MTIGKILIIGITLLLLLSFIVFFSDVTSGLYVIIGLSVGMIALIAMILNPFLGILLIIIVNQFDNLINLPMSSTAGRLIGVLVAIGWFLKYFYRKKTNFFNFIELNKIALFFIISMIVSSLLASYPGRSLKSAFTINLLILMVFFLQDFINSKKNLDLFIMIFALSVGLGSLVGIIQYKTLIVGSMTLGTVTYEGAGQIARTAGLTLNPNGYGVMLLSVIPVLLFLSLNSEKQVIKLFSFFLFFTSIISLGLTLSRTNIFGFIIFLFIFIYNNIRYRNVSKKQIMYLVTILIIITAIVSILLLDILKMRSSFEDSSTNLRLDMFLKGTKLLIEHPLFGIGFGNFELVERFDDKYGYIYGRPGHDILSVLFVSTGLLGSILFIIICYKTLKSFNLAIRDYIKKNDKYLLNLSITMKSAFIALLSTSPGNPIIFQRILWIYIALAFVMYRWSKMKFRTFEDHQQILIPSYYQNS